MNTSPTSCFVLKIGSKGEIFPPKQVRERLGLVKDQSIILSVEGDKITIRKLDSVESILQQPTRVVISPSAMKELRRGLSEDLEK
jgi:bifunctional DNA-binding transcriptional regulator/antitoxin component of YhaV-PrlF toxin-antitoxin module